MDDPRPFGDMSINENFIYAILDRLMKRNLLGLYHICRYPHFFLVLLILASEALRPPLLADFLL